MQTWLVHMRHPIQLWRSIGTKGFFAFQFFIGAPPFTMLLAPSLWAIDRRWSGASDDLDFGWLFPEPFGTMALFNLVIGNLFLVYFGVDRRAEADATTIWYPSGIMLPFYWVLHSIAAYKAFWQLMLQSALLGKDHARHLARHPVCPRGGAKGIRMSSASLGFEPARAASRGNWLLSASTLKTAFFFLVLLLITQHVIDGGYIRYDIAALQTGDAWRTGGWLTQGLMHLVGLLPNAALQQTTLSILTSVVFGAALALLHSRLRQSGWTIAGAALLLLMVAFHAATIYTLTAESGRIPVVIVLAVLVLATRSIEDGRRRAIDDRFWPACCRCCFLQARRRRCWSRRWRSVLPCPIRTREQARWLSLPCCWSRSFPPSSPALASRCFSRAPGSNWGSCSGHISAPTRTCTLAMSSAACWRWSCSPPSWWCR